MWHRYSRADHVVASGRRRMMASTSSPESSASTSPAKTARYRRGHERIATMASDGLMVV
jgi:hypothetical protein